MQVIEKPRRPAVQVRGTHTPLADDTGGVEVGVRIGRLTDVPGRWRPTRPVTFDSAI